MNNKIIGIFIGVLVLGVVVVIGMNNPEMSMSVPGGEEFETAGSNCMMECSYPAPFGSWDSVDCDGDTGCSCDCNPSAACEWGEDKKSKYRLFNG